MSRSMQFEYHYSGRVVVSELLETSEYIGDGLWRWSISLPSDAPLDEIERVVYTLHPTFSKPVRKVLVPENGFAVQDITSAPFTVYARIVYKDGTEQLLEKALHLTPRSTATELNVSKPRKSVIIIVDDDPDVLRTVGRDLRARYGGGLYKVLAFESGCAALEYLGSKLDEEVALIITDQRMPELDGVSFLAEASRFSPHAKRAVLSAYSDAATLMTAINSGVSRYILKPWDPPEKHLYPVIDELLYQWWSTRGDVSVGDSLRTRIL